MRDHDDPERILQTLIDALRQRDAAEPDLPYWEASERVHALEAKLLRRFDSLEAGATDAPPEGPPGEPAYCEVA